MKKLLGLLASTSLITSSSISVIACGKTPAVSTDDNVLTTKTLIDEFIAEINNIIYHHFNQIRPNLMRLLSGNYNDFFTEENITTYGVDNHQPNKIPPPLGDLQKQAIISAYTALVDVVTLQKEINNLAHATDKYNILIYNGQVVGNINFDINSFIMNFVNDTIFLSNAKITMAVSYNYLDYQKNVVNAIIYNDVILTITDNSIIETGVTQLENNLANDLINSDSTAVWNKATDFGYTQENLYQAFELYNDQKRTRKLSDLINSEGWQTTINNFITEKNYFNGSISSTTSLDFKSQQIKSDQIISKIEPITHISTPKTYQESQSLRETILQKYEANDDVSFVSGTSKGNQEIYDILNETFKTSYSNFKTSLEENISNYNGTNLDKDNILFGQTVISGLGLNFEELNFVLPINTLTLSYSFSLTGNDFDVAANSTLDKSHLGTAVYKNTEAGIKSFQDNFGVVDSKTSNVRSRFIKRAETNSYEEIRVPLIFKGTKITNPLSVNIFDELKKFNDGQNLDANLDKWNSLNEIFSLNTDQLTSVKFNLLTDGYQGKFSFGVKNIFRFSNYIYDLKTWTPGPQGHIQFQWGQNLQGSSPNTFVVSSQKSMSNKIPDGYDKPFAALNQGFEINLNLLSLFVSLPEFNYYNPNILPADEIPTVSTVSGQSTLFRKY